eukprot:TRINITY_DN1283_c0_g1_i4.p1 TRINITY_DN1283_c0_g1~~TRINITY_DN1283_c0_g1_i4.p1  ORF type:complete len:678 (-),score=109.07 TRINITY_DN1283_c0_g1_i4:130-2163(-)
MSSIERKKREPRHRSASVVRKSPVKGVVKLPEVRSKSVTIPDSRSDSKAHQISTKASTSTKSAQSPQHEEHLTIILQYLHSANLRSAEKALEEESALRLNSDAESEMLTLLRELKFSEAIALVEKVAKESEALVAQLPAHAVEDVFYTLHKFRFIRMINQNLLKQAAGVLSQTVMPYVSAQADVHRRDWFAADVAALRETLHQRKLRSKEPKQRDEAGSPLNPYLSWQWPHEIKRVWTAAQVASKTGKGEPYALALAKLFVARKPTATLEELVAMRQRRAKVSSLSPTRYAQSAYPPRRMSHSSIQQSPSPSLSPSPAPAPQEGLVSGSPLSVTSESGRVILPKGSGQEKPHFKLHSTLVDHKGIPRWLDLNTLTDRLMVASAGDDSAVQLWDLSLPGRVASLTGHRGAVTCVQFDPQQKLQQERAGAHLLVSCGQDKTVRLWDWQRATAVVQWVGHSRVVNQVAFVPNDPARVVSCSSDHSMKVWNVHGTHFESTLNASSPFSAMCFLQQGAMLLGALSKGQLRCYKPRLSTLLRSFTVPDMADQFITSLAPHPHDENYVLIAGDREAVIRLFDLRNERVVSTYAGAGYAASRSSCAAFSPQGEHVYSASSPSIGRPTSATTGVYLWGSNSRAMTVLPCHDLITFVRWTEVGSLPLMVAASADRTLRVYTGISCIF